MKTTDNKETDSDQVLGEAIGRAFAKHRQPSMMIGANEFGVTMAGIALAVVAAWRGTVPAWLCLIPFAVLTAAYIILTVQAILLANTGLRLWNDKEETP